jgi:anti-sigma factor RsiW
MKEHTEIRGLLNLSAAGALSDAEQQQLKQHLAQCESCRAELEEWGRLAAAIRAIPAACAPPGLAFRTRRFLEAQMAARQEIRKKQLLFGLLVLFSWAMTILNWFCLRLLDIPVGHWLDISSRTVWVVYIGVTWATAALAAGLLGKHLQREVEPV